MECFETRLRRPLKDSIAQNEGKRENNHSCKDAFALFARMVYSSDRRQVKTYQMVTGAFFLSLKNDG